jgi:soluble lytic murein transglycosylase-like protein
MKACILVASLVVGGAALTGCTTSDPFAEFDAPIPLARPDLAPATLGDGPSEPDAAAVASFVPRQGAAPETRAFAAPAEVDALIVKYAAVYDVPADLIRRVVKRESNFNPRARNRVYWGLMQIRHDTARSMGYKGSAGGLLDADTNLKYAVKYLRGAYITADGDHDQAVRFYSRGYYYDAKRKGLLKETGLRS